MKKLLGIVVLGLFLTGCQSGGVTGKMSYGMEESPLWFMTAKAQDINYYYDSHSTPNLCVKWQERFPGTKSSERIRSEITEALVRRGEDGLKCYNPNLDNALIQNAKIERALQRARNAEARAAEAERRAADAQAQAQEAEDSANWIRINCPNGGYGYTCY